MAKDRFSQTGSRVPSELLGKAARYEAARAALLTHMGREDEAQTAIRLQNIYLQRRLDEAGLADNVAVEFVEMNTDSAFR